MNTRSLVVGFMICSCVILLTGIQNVAADISNQFHAVVPRQNISIAKKAEILRSIQSQEPLYNPTEAMLRKNFSWSPTQIHTTWKGDKVHPIRDAAVYVVSLLDTDEKLMETRAFNVLSKVLSLQDIKNESKTYGIWPYFLEESLEKMAPPDWNWADFIGTQLLQVIINHRQRLPVDLAVRLDAAVIHAARSIQRRNVGPSYTNIAIMGTHVTLAVSDIYNITDLKAYSRKRLWTLANYTSINGGFEEYNSPSYTTVAVEELGRMRMHAITLDVQNLTNWLYQIAWKEIIQHYHPATGQWAGPHSRSYRTLLGDGHAKFIMRGLNNELDPRLPLPVPNDLIVAHLSSINQSRTLINTYLRGQSGTRFDLIGTTYMAPSLTVGSINWSEMWNQRRPLVAYWGSKESPSYFQLRFLHDGFDFSNAQIFTAQMQGQVLAGIVLATDGGDKHVSQDLIKNATFKAKDLRFRFEIGGKDAMNVQTTVSAMTNPIRLAFGNVSLQFALSSVHFDVGSEQGWNVSRVNNCLNIDYVLYAGVEKMIKLDQLTAAAAIVAVQLSSGINTWTNPVVVSQDSVLRANWTNLQLSIPSKPSKVVDLRKNVKYSFS
jgi:hypothetical protein